MSFTKGKYMMDDSSHKFALSDEELQGLALDGEALPIEKQEHLAQCPSCQQRLAEISQMHAALVTHFYRRFCPDSTQLSLYSADMLNAVERTRIANHLLECPLCMTEVAYSRRFLRDAPVEMEPIFSPLSAVRRVFGVLTKQQAQLVTRASSENTTQAWPRQYRAENVDLSLHLSRASKGEHMLLGILTSTNSDENVDQFEGANAELYSGSLVADIGQVPQQEPLRRTQIDDLGNVVFNSVPLGNYVLMLHLPNQDVVIEQITIT